MEYRSDGMVVARNEPPLRVRAISVSFDVWLIYGAYVGMCVTFTLRCLAYYY
ncbi:hypothetical protein HdyHp2_115 [Haloarcula virus Hardyhisp2]|uniref:Uncharacterized protein n=1 Tax=Haloarcula virus Hardyhisp2 TaxID=2811386 RepID=A0A898KCV7_9VIRU|nr:hypothetical protein QIT44_gp23 [Haloarcula virus Hardyhisp2]QSJ05043.1 hypothetical protein HdyHp2_115 [Haloarcula virus Hardyhisp2]